MKFKTYFTYTGFGLLVLVLSGCSLLPEKTVDEKSVPSVAQEQTKEYRSEFMKISLQIPKDWVVEEKQTVLRLKTNLGEITVDRIGTNWSNLQEFIKDFDERIVDNKVLDKKEISLDKHFAIRRREKPNKPNALEELNYYVYIEKRVFTLSTSTPKLYDDLDQIAQSFRYFGK